MPQPHPLALAGALALIAAVQAEPVWYYPCTGKVVTASELDLGPVKNPDAIQVVESKAYAGITWNITYRDVANSTSVGFADPAQGAARRATLEAVLEYFDSILAHGPVTVPVEVQPSLTSGSGALATGGTSWLGIANSFQTGLASTRIRTGTTPFPNDPDIIITVNFGYTWNSGLQQPAANEYDLYSVLVHEVGHGLGFSSLTNSSGASVFGNNIRSVYAREFRTGNGQAVFDSSANFLGVANWLTGSQNGLRYNGVNATLVHGGGGPPLYTPSTFSSSSLSHWDDSVSQDAVMRRNIPPGVVRREWLDFEIATLADFGYTLRGINTPGGWMIL